MRITYRQKGHKEYWEDRWSKLNADEPMSNRSSYPLSYALLASENSKGQILEAGCGGGRLLRYFHAAGNQIVGFDYIHSIVAKLKQCDTSLQLHTADVTRLPYRTGSFGTVLAFGLLHNLPLECAQAGLQEMSRVLVTGGKICVSYRADNLQNWINDFITGPTGSGWLSHIVANMRVSGGQFHKMNLRIDEFQELIKGVGLQIESSASATNMPLVYKLKWFRATTHREFSESLAREEGYQLSLIGRFVHSLLMRFPRTFCNVHVIVARKA